MDKYTSLELSKKLYDNGCELDSDYCFCVIEHYNGPDSGPVIEGGVLLHKDILKNKEVYFDCFAYDILNDICVKYAKEFFGYSSDITEQIFNCIKKGEKKEAEDYIWKYCLFNPNNK